MLRSWEKRAKQETCAWCKYERRRNKVMKKQQDNKANRAKRSIGGCAFYNVAVCIEGDY